MGVSRSTVQRYCDQGVLKPHRTLGGHRRVSTAQVAEWLKNNKSRKRRRKKTKPFREAKFSPAYVADALLDGKLSRLDGLLDQIILGRNSVCWLFDQFVAPAMWDIGHRWYNDQISYPDERRATSNLKHLFQTLNRGFGVVEGGPMAVGGSLEGDHSEIGSLMLELLLREAKFDAFHIGPNLPPQTIADIANQMNADLVWVSYCHITDKERAFGDNAVLTREIPEHAKLAIGGYALNDEILDNLDYDFFGKTMADFQIFINEFKQIAVAN